MQNYLFDSLGVQTPAEKPEPPADASDFLEVIYRVSSGIIRAQIRRSEFDFTFLL
jgi:hypothetical protein